MSFQWNISRLFIRFYFDSLAWTKIFCNRMYVNKSQRGPFTFFGTMRHFPKLFFFVPSWGKSAFQVLSSMKGTLWVSRNCFLRVHQYVLGIFWKLCAFWALDIAPTLDVLVLLFVTQVDSPVLRMIFFRSTLTGSICWYVKFYSTNKTPSKHRDIFR